MVDKVAYKDVIKVVNVISGAFDKDYELVQLFKLLDVQMGFIPKLDDMSLGEYVDVENFLGDWQNMHKAMAVLYRPVNFRKKERYTIADYSPSDEISHLMKEMPLDVVMGCMVFLSFRDGIITSYPDLYSQDSEEGYNIGLEGSFGKKWGWYQSIYALARGDVRKFDEVTKLPIHQCLTFLSFEKQKNDLERQMIKKKFK